MAYASSTLIPAETRYAHIEKELLAVEFTCQRFEAYIYGREGVNIETDHKPLEIIMRKPLNTALKRLQHMMLALQKYNLHGETMVLVDTLSCQQTKSSW